MHLFLNSLSAVDPTLRAAAQRKVAESQAQIEECQKLAGVLSQEDAQVTAEINQVKARLVSVLPA